MQQDVLDRQIQPIDTMEDAATVAQELATVADINGGVLRADDVVEFARDPDTALHDKFEWDDTEAARQHRLEQARRVIRTTVRIIPHVSEPVRAFVSIVSDRNEPRGGYRPIVKVLSDDELRAQLVAQAEQELRRVRRAYGHLKELAAVWAAIDDEVEG